MRPPRRKSGGSTGHVRGKTSRRDASSSGDNEDDATALHSPSDQADLTDYGLEFTTSRLSLSDNNGQPRHSTLRPRQQTQVVSQKQPQQEVPDAPTDYEDNDDDDYDFNQENQNPNSRHRSIPVSRQSDQNERQRLPPPIVPSPNVRRKQLRPTKGLRRVAQEIAYLQRTPDLLIPRLPFSRLVREILQNFSGALHFKMTSSALEALQHSSEMFLTQRFQDAYYLTMHRQRVTLEVRDMVLMAFFCKESVV